MTERSLPWFGTVTGDAGAYSHNHWAEAWAGMIASNRANSGPFIQSNPPNIGLHVQASSPADASVDVLAGTAIVNGTFYESDATETLTINDNNSGNARIDTVVLQKDWTAQTVRLAVIEGAPAATPAPPALTQSNGVLWEIPLADIAVANGFSTIDDDDITPRSEWALAADGVYLKDILNNSGITLETGNVVVWDSSADRAADTTTQKDTAVAGVWVGRTENSDYGRLLVQGVGYVYVDGSVSRGDMLVTGSSAGQATPLTSSPKQGIIGRALEARTGAGLVLAYVDVQPGTAVGVSNIDEASDYTTTSNSFVDVDATDLSRTIITRGGDVLVSFVGTIINTNTQSSGVHLDLDVDGNQQGGDDGIIKLGPGTGLQQIVFPVSFMYLVQGLSPGSHTIKLQWKVSEASGTTTATLYAGAGTTRADTHPQFSVKEII